MPPAKALDTVTVIDFPTPPRLSEVVSRFRFDPLGFVMFAFPWGRSGTSLANETGPEPWQQEVRPTTATCVPTSPRLALTFAYPMERRNWQEEWRIKEKLAEIKRRFL